MRLHDWQSRLDVCMRDHMAEPFAWGRNDCVTFAAACVKAVTGADHIEQLRGGWFDERAAARLVRSGGGLVALAAGCLGEEIAPAMAQPGDVGITVQNGRDALCVCAGLHWHGPAAEGLATFSTDQVERAWRCEAT